MTPTSLAARRRLAKAAAILNDPDHPQHTLLADLVDTALALDGDVEFEPWLEVACQATLANRKPCTCEGQCLHMVAAAPCPPRGLPRRGGLFVVPT